MPIRECRSISNVTPSSATTSPKVFRIERNEMPTESSAGFGAAAASRTAPCPKLSPQRDYLIFQASNLEARL